MTPLLKYYLLDGCPGWVPYGASAAFDFVNNQYWLPNATTSLSALPGYSFTRASSAAQVDSAGNWTEVGSGVPRITNLGYLSELSATNQIRNPRAEGGAAGVYPTNWSAIGTTGGWTLTLVGRVTVNGIEGMAFDISGTATDAVLTQIEFEAANTIVASSGQSWTVSPFVAYLTSADTSGVSAITNRVTWQGADTTVAGSDFKSSLSVTPFRAVTTLTAPASTTYLRPRIGITPTASGTVNFRLWVGWPQAVQQAYVSSPVLPPANSPDASTRAADVLRFTGVGQVPVSVFAEYQSTVAIASTSQIMIQYGTPNDGVWMYKDSAGTIRTRVETASATEAQLIFSSLAANTTYKQAARILQNDVASSLDGSAVSADTLVTLPSTTTRNVGCNNSSAAQPVGYIRRLIEFSTPLTDAQLQSLST